MTTRTKKKAKKKEAAPAGNKPKAIYYTEAMAMDMGRIRRIRTDQRISDSALIADALKIFADHLENTIDADKNA